MWGAMRSVRERERCGIHTGCVDEVVVPDTLDPLLRELGHPELCGEQSKSKTARKKIGVRQAARLMGNARPAAQVQVSFWLIAGRTGQQLGGSADMWPHLSDNRTVSDRVGATNSSLWWRIDVVRYRCTGVAGW